MPKLAEPRQRHRYTLVPRGKALYEDDTRFGTKMLEKMGWSKGKGLGAHESGTQDFVRIRYKNDAQGLGFEARDDQWTQHDDSFNGLLASLNGNAKENETVVDDVESDVETPTMGFGFAQASTTADKPKSASFKAVLSGTSLEEQSKKSRARVHYKKFTRGKDLAQYSEKDLANIFGKKAVDEISNNENADNSNNAENNAEGNQSHFQSSKLSVADYFKAKMDKLKEGKQMKQTIGKEEEESVHDEAEEVNGEHIKEKTKKKKKKSKNIEKEEEEAVNEEIAEVAEEHVKNGKDKKKRKKEAEVEPVEEQEQEIPMETLNEETKEKKKKKKKSKEPKDLELVPTEEKINANEKNQKSETICENEDKLVSQSEPLENVTKKDKKKKRKKDEAIAETIETNEATTEPTIRKKSKKRKHNETEEELNHNTTEDKDNKTNHTDDKEINLNLQNIENKLKAEKTYGISIFAAEQFRFTDTASFEGSNLADIQGYGIDEDVQIEIIKDTNDARRIDQLWSCTIDKYQFITRPYSDYNEYQKKALEARKNKVKVPRFKAHQHARKDAFKAISI